VRAESPAYMIRGPLHSRGDGPRLKERPPVDDVDPHLRAMRPSTAIGNRGGQPEASRINHHQHDGPGQAGEGRATAGLNVSDVPIRGTAPAMHDQAETTFAQALPR